MPKSMYPAAKNTPRASVLQSLQTKRAIIDDVIDGRLPLWDAAPKFQAAHVAASQCLESATGVPNPLMDRETLCRTIIGWVHLSLSDCPETADRVSDRLESELSSYLNRPTR